MHELLLPWVYSIALSASVLYLIYIRQRSFSSPKAYIPPIPIVQYFFLLQASSFIITQHTIALLCHSFISDTSVLESSIQPILPFLEETLALNEYLKYHKLIVQDPILATFGTRTDTDRLSENEAG